MFVTGVVFFRKFSKICMRERVDEKEGDVSKFDRVLVLALSSFLFIFSPNKFNVSRVSFWCGMCGV